MLSMISPAWRRVALLMLIAAAVAAIGCGGSDSDDETTTTGAAATTTGGEATTEGDGQQAADLKPLAPVKPKESIEEAKKRISKTIASGDCDRIAALNPVSRQPEGEAVQTRCNLYTNRLENAEAKGAESFGRGGGVIDYTAPARDFSLLLLADQDGEYHIGFLDAYLGEATVGTKPAKQFDEVAKEAVEALGDRDCEAFLAVANRQLGPGSLDKSATCDYVENNPIGTLLENYPEAKLEGFGGNADFAFYGLAGPGATYTLVMARESDKNPLPNGDPLPKDAPEYSLAGVFRTNVKSGG